MARHVTAPWRGVRNTAFHPTQKTDISAYKKRTLAHGTDRMLRPLYILTPERIVEKISKKAHGQLSLCAFVRVLGIIAAAPELSLLFFLVQCGYPSASEPAYSASTPASRSPSSAWASVSADRPYFVKYACPDLASQMRRAASISAGYTSQARSRGRDIETLPRLDRGFELFVMTPVFRLYYFPIRPC